MSRDRIETCDGRTVVSLVGDIDQVGQPERLALFDEAIALGLPVVIDLAEAAFVDSSGLRVLVLAHKRCAEAGLPLSVRNLSPQTQRLFEISALDRVISRED